MDLTTEARVRAMVEITETLPTTATLTSYIGNLISQWSERAVQLLNRQVTVATYTAYFDVLQGQRVFSLTAFPVSSIVSVTSDRNREFTGSTVAATNYSCQTGSGMLDLYDYRPSAGPGALKVVYRGGMAASAASFAAAYPDIAGAIDMQCVYALERKANMGRQAVSAGAGSVSYVGALDWLPTARRALTPHRRIYCG